MIKLITALFGIKPKAIPVENANSFYRSSLNRARRESISSRPTSISRANMETRGSVAATSRQTKTAGIKSSEDGSCFGTSMIVGAKTGSTVAGCIMGGSLTGAMVGSSMHQDSSGQDSQPLPRPTLTETVCEPSESRPPSFESASYGSSDSGSSGGCEY